MKKMIVLVMVLICFVGLVMPICSYETNKTVIGVEATEAVIIDGKDDEGFWAEAPIAPGSFWNRETGAEATFKTKVRVAYDKEYFYAFVVAIEEKEIAMATKKADGSGIFAYDCLAAVFFMPGGAINWFAVEPTGGKVFYIGSGNTVDPDVTISTQVYPGKCWKAEFRIAWETMDFPMSGLQNIRFSADRRRQNPWEWCDWNYIGREENNANVGYALVKIPKRPLKANLALEEVVKYNFDKDSVSDKLAATISGTSHSWRFSGSHKTLDEYIARAIEPISYSYFSWRPPENRRLLIENNSIFALLYPGYYWIWGNSFFDSTTIQDIKDGYNIVYKNAYLTMGSIGTISSNEAKDKNLVLRGFGGLAGGTLGGYYLARYNNEQDKAQNAFSTDFTKKGKGYLFMNQFAFAEDYREEGKLAFFWSGLEPALSWYIKGKENNNPFAYDPLSPGYGLDLAIDKKRNWKKGMIKEIGGSLYADKFNYWKDHHTFYQGGGFTVYTETQSLRNLLALLPGPTKKLKAINYRLSGGVSKTEYVVRDPEKGFIPYKDTVAYSRFVYNLRGSNNFDVLYRLGKKAGGDLRYYSITANLNAGITGIKALRQLSLTTSYEHEVLYETKGQLITTLSYNLGTSFGLASRYVLSEVDGKRKIDNIYFAAWYASKYFEVHNLVGLSNKDKFIPEIGFKLVGKIPISDLIRFH